VSILLGSGLNLLGLTPIILVSDVVGMFVSGGVTFGFAGGGSKCAFGSDSFCWHDVCDV